MYVGGAGVGRVDGRWGGHAACCGDACACVALFSMADGVWCAGWAVVSRVRRSTDGLLSLPLCFPRGLGPSMVLLPNSFPSLLAVDMRWHPSILDGPIVMHSDHCAGLWSAYVLCFGEAFDGRLCDMCVWL
eukprot:TRINITY_DN3909_c0_g1_i1.p1 TRINITY_DN3909_c0_g1~~TRINITY_DN3909_c0_g1_i1.p1  ORF type:complete len:131 (+),score=7.40 TRINITY_DN3909_c0_g1_i1:22-414(+)